LAGRYSNAVADWSVWIACQWFGVLGDYPVALVSQVGDRIRDDEGDPL
jgi:hypothetical protein